ncbi:MAG: DinB family protein [Candidatus Rokuibacteriota bacterium]
MVDRALVLASLRATPRMLREMSRDCTAGQAWTPPKAGEWSIAEVVRHLVEGDRDTFLPRLRRMLAETRPVFDRTRPAPETGTDLHALLLAFETARGQALTLLDGLDEAGWQRAGVSPSRGALTVQAYAHTMAEHDTEHLQQIQDVREALGLLPRRCEARRALPMPEVIAALAATRPRLEQLADGVGIEPLRRRPKEGEWCMKEVMAHLAHIESDVFLPRLRRMVAEERPAFEPFSAEAWAQARDHREGRFTDDLGAFASARRQTIALLNGLPAAAATRIGLSGFFGPVTLAQYATHIVDHDLEHLAQMTDCRLVALHQDRA